MWGDRMKNRRMAAVVLMTAVLIILQIFPVWAKEEQLYALSAVLMDGETGRVLYGKEAYKGRPNASTTKVMTCILALEMASGDDYVQVSRNAASQPQTHLGMREGQQFYLEDLLYSLMLKSHNDTAVAIAEHIGGSVEKFALLMNEKAKSLGCTDTHFVTPNGLDAEDEGGVHHTTARDLALIMAYAIKNATFVHITQTRDYTFSDISGKEHYSVHNTNAFLDMETGVISGKTGYCGTAWMWLARKQKLQMVRYKKTAVLWQGKLQLCASPGSSGPSGNHSDRCCAGGKQSIPGER